MADGGLWNELARQADADYVGFWENCAKELIDWHRPWTQVLDDSNKPFFKWFVNAKTNIVFNAVDRHLKTPRRNKLALIWEGAALRAARLGAIRQGTALRAAAFAEIWQGASLSAAGLAEIRQGVALGTVGLGAMREGPSLRAVGFAEIR